MMTKDLTPLLIEALQQLKSWSNRELMNVLSEISQLIPEARINWDREAGEDWLSISVGKKWIGIIRVDFPIAFFNDDYSKLVRKVLKSHNVKMIAVNDFSEPSFKLDLSQVKEILPGGWHADPDAVDPNSLSIADFWYATI